MNLRLRFQSRRLLLPLVFVLCIAAFPALQAPAGARPQAGHSLSPGFLTQPLPQPAAWWKFNEGTGSTASDASGSGNDGTLQSGILWAPGKIDDFCLNLPGTDTGYVDIPKPVVDTTTSYTAMAWVKFTHLGGFQTFVSIDGDQVSGFYLQLRGDTQKLSLSVLQGDASDPNTPATAQSNDAPAANTWIHIAGVYDADVKRIALYINGVLQETSGCPSAWKANGHTVIGRGKFDGHPTDYTSGYVDDVRFYASALSAQQVRSIAGTTIASP